MNQLPAILGGDRRRLLLRLIGNGVLQALMVIGSMLLVRHAFNVLLNPEFNDPSTCSTWVKSGRSGSSPSACSVAPALLPG